MIVRRAVIPTIVAATALLLVGCDVFTTTPFPPYLSYVSAELDVSGEVPDAIRSVTLEATFSDPGGERFFSIYVEPDSAESEVYILVDQDLSVRFVETSDTAPPFDTHLFVTTQGRIQKGNVIYDPTTNEVLNVPRIDDDSNPTILTDSEKYYLFRSNGADIEIVDYSDNFVEDGTTSPNPLLGAISDGTRIRNVDAAYRWGSDPGAPDFALFLLDEQERVFRAVIAVADIFSLTEPLVDATADPVLPELELDSLQDTPQGLLGRDYQTLYRLNGDTGGVRDSFDLGERAHIDGAYPIVFDPAGEFYLLFDVENRVLYRVAPWW